MKPPLIILEGPDGTGKTTLAGKLSSDFSVPVVHCGPPGPDGALAEYTKIIASVAETGAVLDRFHIGERVYGPLVRGVDTLGFAGQLAVELAAVRTLDTVMVVVNTSFATVKRNWESRRGRELLQDEDLLRTVHLQYSAYSRECSPAINNTTLQTLFFDPFTQSYEALLHDLSHILDRRPGVHLRDIQPPRVRK